MVKSKNHDFPPNSRNMEAKPSFFISKARLAFIKLKQMFVKAPIFNYFKLKYHIKIKSNRSEYSIGKILSQLTLNDLN